MVSMRNPPYIVFKINETYAKSFFQSSIGASSTLEFIRGQTIRTFMNIIIFPLITLIISSGYIHGSGSLTPKPVIPATPRSSFSEPSTHVERPPLDKAIDISVESKTNQDNCCNCGDECYSCYSKDCWGNACGAFCGALACCCKYSCKVLIGILGTMGDDD